MGTKAYQVRRFVDPVKGHVGGPVQVVVRASNPEIARQQGANMLGVKASAVTVTAFRTAGAVPGGDPVAYREAEERWARGEAITNDDEA